MTERAGSIGVAGHLSSHSSSSLSLSLSLFLSLSLSLSLSLLSSAHCLQVCVKRSPVSRFMYLRRLCTAVIVCALLARDRTHTHTHMFQLVWPAFAVSGEPRYHQRALHFFFSSLRRRRQNCRGPDYLHVAYRSPFLSVLAITS